MRIATAGTDVENRFRRNRQSGHGTDLAFRMANVGSVFNRLHLRRSGRIFLVESRSLRISRFAQRYFQESYGLRERGVQ